MTPDWPRKRRYRPRQVKSKGGPGEGAQLCTNCGLCCNGVLFADVELRKSDSAGQLTALGLTLARKGRKTVFAQPCSCFDGKLCQIYTHRPQQCRAFACGLLKRVSAGQLTSAAALQLIGRVQRQAAQIRDLLRALGNHEEELPLSRRYQKVTAEPIDLMADEADIERRGSLMLQVDELMKLVQRHFLA